MSYCEENGEVILTMSREDYDALLDWLQLALGVDYCDTADHALLCNRLNEGNPHYTPYQVEAKKS